MRPLVAGLAALRVGLLADVLDGLGSPSAAMAGVVHTIRALPEVRARHAVL